MNILLTKKISPSHFDLIQSWGWNVEAIETLKISPVEVKEIPQAEVWIVSSRNSFGVLRDFIGQAPDFIYSVGHWMEEELIKIGAKSVIRSFANMKKLVDDLTKQNVRSVLYFCGNEHRQELEDGLKGSTVKISKVITHQSQMTFPIVKSWFDAVFVFSPRSAESLLKNNSFKGETIFACIGSTTASYLNSRGITNTFTSSSPDSGVLLEEFHHRF